MSQWLNRNSPDVMTYLSSNSDQDIHNARQFWFPSGISATAFLIAATYLGWWYQRNLRAKFHNLVNRMDLVNVRYLMEIEGTAFVPTQSPPSITSP